MRLPFLYSLLLCLPCFASGGDKSKRPNFVFILADDQGSNALSVPMDPDDPATGSSYYETPHLAGLAKAGMRFSQAYSPAPTCSPTRHALQFGRSPSSLKIFGADKIKNWDAEDRDALPHALRRIDKSYVCAHLGKWHIGHSPESLGYDVHDGSTSNAAGNSKDPKDPKLIFDLSRRSCEFLEKQAKSGTPFFLQISHYADHLKYQARPETIRKYEKERAGRATKYQKSPLWAAMNEDLDSGIGMVLKKIEELGLGDNTYVFYTADNGYELKLDLKKSVEERGYYKAYPQRSHKYHVSEGGIRVPFIVRGPGIPAGAHSPVPVVGTDIFTTVLSLAGGKADSLPRGVEGADLTAHLRSGGKEVIDRADPFLVFKHTKFRPPFDVTLIEGRYKFLIEIDTGKRFLFDLNEDIGESKNLSEKMPERTARMEKAMWDYFARFGWDASQIK